MIDTLYRDELFNKIEDNKEKYKQFIEKSMAVDSDYQKNFPQGKSLDIIMQYNNDYNERLKELSDEKNALDSEWAELKNALEDFIKNLDE